MAGRSLGFSVVLAWLLAGRVAALDCALAPEFGLADLSGPAYAFAEVASSTGPELYVTGDFTTAGNVLANHIARWDGSAWNALPGPSGVGLSGPGRALLVVEEAGAPVLYVGGSFGTAGGLVANGIARWDGSSWSTLAGPAGTGLSNGGQVEALLSFDDGSGPALYVGGSFLEAGGVASPNLARWHGGWSRPSAATPGNRVSSLAVFDDGRGPALYVGGFFTTVGALVVNHVARLASGAWEALEGPGDIGTNQPVMALAVLDDGAGEALFAGGVFLQAGDVAVDRVARWDGSAWSALTGPDGTGIPAGVVETLLAFEDDTGPALGVGGTFTIAGGVAARSVAQWRAGAWSSLPARQSLNGVDGDIYALAAATGSDGPVLAVGGRLRSAGTTAAGGVLLFDGSGWRGVAGGGSLGLDGPVRALAAFDDGRSPALVAGGLFRGAGEVAAERVALWDGSAWLPLTDLGGTGTSGPVYALAVFNAGSGPELYVGGQFDRAGGTAASNLARWNGREWRTVGAGAAEGLSGPVFALTVFDDGSGPALYVAGSFARAGGVLVNGVARWRGGHWEPLGLGPTPGLTGPNGTGTGSAFAVFDDGGGPGLYVSGSFDRAGGLVVKNLARFRNLAWSDLPGPGGTGLDRPGDALAVYDDGSGPALYVAGSFNSAGGVPAGRAARWDGESWSSLPGPSGEGFDLPVETLAVFDAGDGPALYAGGSFTRAGGIAASRLARWRGLGWEPLPVAGADGVEATVFSLRPFDVGSGPSLFLGGDFATAGGRASARLARFHCNLLFADGFETGDTGAWSRVEPRAVP
jgi:trimeric autotransporter adhesin